MKSFPHYICISLISANKENTQSFVLNAWQLGLTATGFSEAPDSLNNDSDPCVNQSQNDNARLIQAAFKTSS